MKKGRCGTMTHDYKRNGTTTLFAALNVLDGKVIGRCMQRHRHQEFIRFLNTIEREVPAGKPSMSSSTTTPPTSIPRFGMAGAPSALDVPLHANLRLLAQRRRGLLRHLTKRRLKRGVFRSIVELQAAINRFLAETKPVQALPWTADPDKIIAAVKRGHQVLDSIH